MGYAGNTAPQIIIPTAMASKGMDAKSSSSLAAFAGSGTSSRSTFNLIDQDVSIGHAATELAKSKEYSLLYPIRHGQVCDWDLMERFWQSSIFDYLKCEPEDHLFLLTEPPLNPPENRAMTAEILFESFNVAGLHIAVQAVLALAASWAASPAIAHGSTTKPSLTGTVIDSGDGVTHVIPVVDGFVISSAIQSVPIAGREITFYIQSLLRERGAFPQNIQSNTFDISREIKELFCYTCSDPKKEALKLSEDPTKIIKEFALQDGNVFIILLTSRKSD